MKSFLMALLLLPCLLRAQGENEYLIFEIATIRVNPINMTRVESGMADHNKKYHASGQSGARV